MLSEKDISTIKLILRSPDRGEGWRTVSPMCWTHYIEPFEAKELIETDFEIRRVRLSEKGKIVAEYL